MYVKLLSLHRGETESNKRLALALVEVGALTVAQRGGQHERALEQLGHAQQALEQRAQVPRLAAHRHRLDLRHEEVALVVVGRKSLRSLRLIRCRRQLGSGSGIDRRSRDRRRHAIRSRKW